MLGVRQTEFYAQKFFLLIKNFKQKEKGKDMWQPRCDKYVTKIWLKCSKDIEKNVKVVLIRFGIYFIVNKARGDRSPNFFIHTLWCRNYMRLKFHSYDIRTSLKAVSIHFFEK